MAESFKEMLAAGGKSNSLGRVGEVIEVVLRYKNQLDELYGCLFDDDAWIRMRAADALEKICREHPSWLEPYVDNFQTDLATSDQASIQWHLAQIYRQVDLNSEQKLKVINWLKELLSDTNVDWIVAANAMDTLVQFAKDGSISEKETLPFLYTQQKHKSKSVVKRADKLINLLAV